MSRKTKIDILRNFLLANGNAMKKDMMCKRTGLSLSLLSIGIAGYCEKRGSLGINLNIGG